MYDRLSDRQIFLTARLTISDFSSDRLSDRRMTISDCLSDRGRSF